jgi:hypothetical protein
MEPCVLLSSISECITLEISIVDRFCFASSTCTGYFHGFFGCDLGGRPIPPKVGRKFGHAKSRSALLLPPPSSPPPTASPDEHARASSVRRRTKSCHICCYNQLLPPGQRLPRWLVALGTPDRAQRSPGPRPSEKVPRRAPVHQPLPLAFCPRAQLATNSN